MRKSVAGVWVLVLLTPSAIWSAYVTMRIWQWFAEPIGAPHLSMIRVMGIATLIGMYRYSMADIKAAEENAAEKTAGEMLAGFIGRAFLLPALFLFFGWVYSQFL